MKTKTFTYSFEAVLTELETIGRDQVRLETELDATRERRDELIKVGFEVGLTAKKMVEALGDDPRTGKPVVGPARVFQVRDGK